MKRKQKSAGITRREVLKMGTGAMMGITALSSGIPVFARESKDKPLPTVPDQRVSQHHSIDHRTDKEALKVDFSYSFAPPHRITVGRPDDHDRTLLDVKEGSLRMGWTYDNLSMPNYPPLTFRTPPTLWHIKITPQADNKPFSQSRWTRPDNILPGLRNLYDDPSGFVSLEVYNGISAALVRIGIENSDSKPHQYTLLCEAGWPSENPAWVDASIYAGDNLQAGWNDRADRILILGIGADAYSLMDDGLPPKSTSMILIWNLKPGEKRQGWIIRPYNKYADDLPDLRQHDWEQEQEQGKKEWYDLLNRASKLDIPDINISNAYQACLADLFIMREPLADGYIIGVPGTEVYRAGNSGEPLIADIALDQNGLHKEAAENIVISLAMQEENGCWADRKGWGHFLWSVPGFKSWAAMEHFRLTGDQKFLMEVYPRMLASSRWQGQQREKMRTGENKKNNTYGLMPRGFGDCGLMNDDDMYGVFIPHNIWAVYADNCTLEAAKILGKQEDILELENLYETAFHDLLTVLEQSAVKEQDYRWIPGVPGKTSGSRWGVLNCIVPCGLIPPDHELATGTLRKIESNISEGGQPVHTGWMADGAWVAITLDNVAEAHLACGEGDTAVRYLYSTLNHGTPLYTWCEERGQEPGTTKTSGDRQHLWTPVAVVRFIRDMLVMESYNGLNLALGTARGWLGSGKTVGITGACTHFGTISYRMQYNPEASKVNGEMTFPEKASAAWANLYIRLPEGVKVTSVDAGSKASLLPDGSGLRWETPQGTIRFSAKVG